MKGKTMTKLDYYNRQIKLEDSVTLDYKAAPHNRGVVVGFTPQKVKVYNLYEDRILIIKPDHLTIIKDQEQN